MPADGRGISVGRFECVGSVNGMEHSEIQAGSGSAGICDQESGAAAQACMHDGATAHMAGGTPSFLAEQRTVLPDWKANSPDLNMSHRLGFCFQIHRKTMYFSTESESILR
jgi:hypothetical protein